MNQQIVISHQYEFFLNKNYKLISRHNSSWLDDFHKYKNIPYNFSELFLKYNEEYFLKDNKFYDISFFIYKENSILAFIPLTISKLNNNNKISSQGKNIVNPYFFKNENNINLFEDLYNYFIELMSIFKIKHININSSLNILQNSYFHNYLKEVSYIKNSTICGIIDLEKDLNFIKSKFRKSYKSLVNNKYPNFKLSEVKPDELNKWNTFRDFHFKISNKKTRSDKTWDIQFEMIKKKQASLFLIEDNAKMIGASFINISNFNSFYSVAVFDRSYFPIPLGHILQFFVIKSLKKKNIKYYLISEYKENDMISDKEKNILHFKKGFCSEFVKLNNFQISINE